MEYKLSCELELQSCRMFINANPLPLFSVVLFIPKDLIFCQNLIKRFRLLVFYVSSIANRPRLSRLGIICNYRNTSGVNILGAIYIFQF